MMNDHYINYLYLINLDLKRLLEEHYLICHIIYFLKVLLLAKIKIIN